MITWKRKQIALINSVHNRGNFPMYTQWKPRYAPDLGSMIIRPAEANGRGLFYKSNKLNFITASTSRFQ